MTYQTEEKNGLSCDEAKRVLQVIDLEEEFKNMSPLEIAAVKHYATCRKCKIRESGLSNLLGKKLTCQEALLVWARNPGPLFLNQETCLEDELAVEHVWGKYRFETESRGPDYDTTTGCQSDPCYRLRDLWQNAPFSCSNNGEWQTAGELSLLIEAFKEQDWPLDELFKIALKRTRQLLDMNINRNDFSEAARKSSYQNMRDVSYEIERILLALQRLAT